MLSPPRLGALALLAAALSTTAARGDDLADEADLRFQLGAEAYQRGDFTGALQHFLASNRLVPNKNVLFNVGRAYEKLGKFPESYRYYDQSLSGEADPAARARIEDALGRIRANVLLLDVRSEPPGATIYIERKDLGPRGETPRSLAFAPGRYRVIAELDGHHPAQAEVGPGAVGQALRVELRLAPVLGTLSVGGPTRGAEVRLGTPTGDARCKIPCRLSLPPGEHVLHVALQGFRDATLRATVPAGGTALVEPQLDRLSGTLVVGTDVPGALVSIDGRAAGFAPVILRVTEGAHDVSVSLEGFQTTSRRVIVPAERETRVEIQLTQTEQVAAASRTVQLVEDAPSSVTIVPRQELVALAYPTIAEAVRGVRGLYVWEDRAYASVGVRGVGLLGNYGNRLLVLYDGHPVNDDWIGSSYVGYDALVDLGDVSHIEVVRGPGSVLYGTNAFSGVVDVVSRYRDVPAGSEVGVSTADNGVARLRARSTARFADGGAWASVGIARGPGRDYFFPELVSEGPAESPGVARGLDGFQAGTLRGRVWWKSATVQWFAGSHSKRLPTAAYETVFGDPRLRQTDTRGFIEARFEPVLSETVTSLSRIHVNHYRFDGTYPYSEADGGPVFDGYRGTWFGLEQRFLVSPTGWLRVTVGGEAQLHRQVHQFAGDRTGTFLDERRPFEIGAAYLTADVEASKRVKLSAGARLDAYSTFGEALNPRGAVLLAPYDGGNTKLVAGTAFRAPSVYELFYNDAGATQVASPDLQPERIVSVELEHAHRFTPTVSAVASLYANHAKDIIVERGTGDSTDPLSLTNSSAPLATVGGELALRRDWRQGWMVSASYGYTYARYLASSSLGDLLAFERDVTRRQVPNAPAHLASVKAAAPIVGRAVTFGTRVTLEGERFDRFENAGDPEQRSTDAAVLWDVVLSGREERWGLGYAAGVYNAFDWQWFSPVGTALRQRTIEQNGRTFLLSADATF